MSGFLKKWLGSWRGARVEISDTQWHDAEYPLPFLDRLDTDERQRLRELAREFIAEKEWSGAAGLTLSAPMQLSIALQACLPILNLGLEWYRGWVGIVVYPGDFVIPRQITDMDGIVHEFDDQVLGEAWEHGPVLLSWFDNPADCGDVSLVIHEFAHKLDMTNGDIDGMPVLHGGMTAENWIAAFAPAYHDFCLQVDLAEANNTDSVIDPYAAESPSEFFAVLSEVFFEAPDILASRYPTVYEQLRCFYRQDPLQGNGLPQLSPP